MPINLSLINSVRFKRFSAALLIIMSITMPSFASDNSCGDTLNNLHSGPHNQNGSLNSIEKYSLSSFKKLLRSQKNAPFKTTSPERYEQAKRLFSLLLQPALQTDSSSFSQQLEQAEKLTGLCSKWIVIKHLKQEHNVLLIMENSERATGQGAYLFMPTGSLNFILQAPHQYFDFSSADIALQLFLENNLRAVAVNSVHRNQTDQSDLAHQEHSLYSAFTEAVVESASEAATYLMQIHGFSNRNRASNEGKEADIILSNGSRTPSYLLQKSQHWLNSNTVFKTYHYGIDINELGGTTNSSLAVMKKHNQQHLFIHLELSPLTRKKLKASRKKREQLWSSFQP